MNTDVRKFTDFTTVAMIGYINNNFIIWNAIYCATHDIRILCDIALLSRFSASKMPLNIFHSVQSRDSKFKTQDKWIHNSIIHKYHICKHNKPMLPITSIMCLYQLLIRLVENLYYHQLCQVIYNHKNCNERVLIRWCFCNGYYCQHSVFHSF